MEEILKADPNSDCRLQFACMKPESLVIAYQPRRGEYVPEPCTHRPSSHESGECSKSFCLTERVATPKASFVIGTKS